MVNFTVAIRAYNAGDRLPALLDHLKVQTHTESFVWEVLVIDNNSCDNTAALVQAYQASWGAICALRYVFEPQQGAAIARRRAMQEAQGEWVGFLDDDNLPAPNWVAAAYGFGQAHAKAGAFGGQIHGQYEQLPPQNFGRIACFLAIVERRQPFCYNSKANGRKTDRVLPPGAGLVIRKQAWLESIPLTQVIQGPTGASIASKGEDIEVLTYLRQAGWEIWNNPEMHIYHAIPAWRLERDYLLQLVRGVGLAKHSLRMLNYKRWQIPFVTIGYLMNDFYKAVAYFLKYRQHLKTDVVVACEMELLVSSFLSPLYNLKRKRTLS
jgi:glycosyltransferase involved in cell wall biosynthesis